MKTLTAALLAGLFTAQLAAGIGPVHAAEGAGPPKHNWPFSGVFGRFDRAAMQRGLQVYREVCSACHGLKYIAFRNLEALGYGEEEIKAMAAEYTIADGPNDDGDMFERPGRPSDYFPSPFANDKAAAAANNGAAPPDLSLMAKARPGGPDQIRALMLGYEDPPAGVEAMEGLHFNIYFPGNQIAMAAPLSEGAVEYADGTEATVEQMATDVANFLMWTAEPYLEERHSMGIKVILFLLVFTGILYAAKRKVWSDLH
jgi:ubiquinol-cytochrome c reductase cytochrome c1 subunit